VLFAGAADDRTCWSTTLGVHEQRAALESNELSFAEFLSTRS
jgi:hypothetical protein